MRKENRRVRKDKTPAVRRWRSFWKLLLCAALVSFLVLDGYRFTQRFQYWCRNREIKREYIEEVERLRQEQQRLKEEIYKLRYSPLAQERIAREMGYIKPGETVYKFIPKTDTEDRQ
jgi:cell division protein FtsB